MKILEYSYRFAKEILEHNKYKEIYDELLEICKNCPLPYYPEKSKDQKKLDIVQQLINTYFKIAFDDMGWQSEPLATPQEEKDSLRSDFRKRYNNEINVQVEVEMGNAASSYRNYFKFQLSFSHSLADVCVIILPTTSLSKRIDSGVASFEKTVREIPSAKLSITVPILVIGLDDKNEKVWDVKSITNDLSIVKGSSKKHTEQHLKLVIDYISQIKKKKKV